MNPYSWRVTEWLNETSRNQTFCFLLHSRSHRCSPSHIFLTLRLYLAAASLSRLCFFSCPHINSSIYSMSLPTLNCCLCHWKSEEWVLRSQYAALSGQGKRKGEEESPIDRQANTSQALSTLSPLCSSARRQQMRGIWRGGTMRENSWCIVWATGWKCKERRMRGEAWGKEERALDWPLCWISSLSVNRNQPPIFLHVTLTCEQWSHTEQPHMVTSPCCTPLPAPTH